MLGIQGEIKEISSGLDIVSIEVDEDGLLNAYILSTLGSCKSFKRRNDPSPPVEPVSNMTEPMGYENQLFAAPLTMSMGNNRDPDSPTQYFS